MQFRGAQCCRLLVYIDWIEFSGFDDDRPGRYRRMPLGPEVACHVGEAPTNTYPRTCSPPLEDEAQG